MYVIYTLPCAIWDLQYQYLRESNLKGLKYLLRRYIFYKMRQWDVRSSNGVDQFVEILNLFSADIPRRPDSLYNSTRD